MSATDILLALPIAACVVAFVYSFFRDRNSNDRAKASTMGFCPSCGYDMRVNRDRCSECGWARQEPS